MSTEILLKGITWNHSRGYTPMIATAQRFMEVHPELQISWQKRTLQDFADKPIGQLTEDFDLLVIDHPWIGYAAENHQFTPLNNHFSSAFLHDLENNSVGRSFESYQHVGQQWALPIDAATPVASFRPDLLKKYGLSIPQNFEQLLTLARKGRVIVPGIAIDTLMNFFMFCASLGEAPFTDPHRVISPEIGLAALGLLKTFMESVDPICFQYNPIQVYEQLTNTDDYVYCPFAYGYSNYARIGYSKQVLQFADLILLDINKPLISTLGGTGLAISSNCQHPEAAFKYLEFVASGFCQEHLYFESGGQPAHLKAWESQNTNLQTSNFFAATLKTLNQSYLRPRYNGYISFQDQAGDVIRDYLIKGGDPIQVLENLQQLLNQAK